MNIYNTFYYSAAHPVASGNLVAFRQVKRVYPFEAAYRRTIIFRLQELFAGKTEELRKACEALGGTLLPQGDRKSVVYGKSLWGMCFRYFLF